VVPKATIIKILVYDSCDVRVSGVENNAALFLGFVNRINSTQWRRSKTEASVLEAVTAKFEVLVTGPARSSRR
jgi:hypothetical protein